MREAEDHLKDGKRVEDTKTKPLSKKSAIAFVLHMFSAIILGQRRTYEYIVIIDSIYEEHKYIIYLSKLNSKLFEYLTTRSMPRKSSDFW